jgi:hypothetical protein
MRRAATSVMVQIRTDHVQGAEPGSLPRPDAAKIADRLYLVKLECPIADGLFIMRSIAGPPVFRKCQTRMAARMRKPMFSQVV